jgi:hypothetical protein
MGNSGLTSNARPALTGLLCALLVPLLVQLAAAQAQNGAWAITNLPAEYIFGNHPSINNSGEIVYQQDSLGIVSSRRGVLVLSATAQNPHIADSGEVVYADMFEGPLLDLVSTTRGRLTFAGTIMSDFGIQSSGEVVFAALDTNSIAQVYSTVRGQITFDPNNHYDPCVNDNGEIVWSETVLGVGVFLVSNTRGTLTNLPGVTGVGGCIVTGLNNHGDLSYTGNLESSPGYYTSPHIFSSSHGAVIDDPSQYQWYGSLNDAGTLIWMGSDGFYEAQWVVPPVLSILTGPDGLALEWITNGSAFHVQYTTNTAPPFLWQAGSAAVTTNGSSFHQAINTNPMSAAFFRLSTGSP